MKARFLSIVLVVAVLCSFSPSGFGAGKPKAKPNKKEKESIEVPFDVTVERLPPRFWGNNLIKEDQRGRVFTLDKPEPGRDPTPGKEHLRGPTYSRLPVTTVFYSRFQALPSPRTRSRPPVSFNHTHHI